MALLKTIKCGEELIFDLKDKIEGAKKISVVLVENAGGRSFLKISADRSIRIHHIRSAGHQDSDHFRDKRGGATREHTMKSLYD